MTGLLRNEFEKVRLATLARISLFCVLFVGLGTAGTAVGQADQLDLGQTIPREAFRLAVSMSFAGMIAAMILGALLFTNEFRHNTIATSWIHTPDRRRSIAAKVGVAMIYGVLIGLIAFGTSYLCSAVVFSSRGYDVSFDSGIQQSLIASLIVSGLSAPLGLAFGVGVRNSTVAVIGIFAWSMIAEPSIGVFADGVFRWLPGGAQNAITIAHRHAGEPSFASGVALLTAYMLVGCIAAVAWARTLDIK